MTHSPLSPAREWGEMAGARKEKGRLTYGQFDITGDLTIPIAKGLQYTTTSAYNTLAQGSKIP